MGNQPLNLPIVLLKILLKATGSAVLKFTRPWDIILLMKNYSRSGNMQLIKAYRYLHIVFAEQYSTGVPKKVIGIAIPYLKKFPAPAKTGKKYSNRSYCRNAGMRSSAPILRTR